MKRISRGRNVALVVLAVLFPFDVEAQAGGGGDTTLRAQPSGRGRASVVLQRQAGDRTPVTISVDYGQPHARGRTILGGLVPYDAIWRTGANQATVLRTDADLVIGGAVVPKGTYTLCTLPSRAGWKLIINRAAEQMGQFCPPDQDLARVDLRVRQREEPLESLTIWLIPSVESATGSSLGRGLPRGELRIGWSTFELSTDWRLR